MSAIKTKTEKSLKPKADSLIGKIEKLLRRLMDKKLNK